MKCWRDLLAAAHGAHLGAWHTGWHAGLVCAPASEQQPMARKEEDRSARADYLWGKQLTVWSTAAHSGGRPARVPINPCVRSQGNDGHLPAGGAFLSCRLAP